MYWMLNNAVASSGGTETFAGPSAAAYSARLGSRHTAAAMLGMAWTRRWKYEEATTMARAEKPNAAPTTCRRLPSRTGRKRRPPGGGEMAEGS